MNPNGPNFDWNDLRSFLAIVRAGRLTVAANQLGIDHSTLSRHITALETALQVRLFDRLLTGYALTDHGRNLVSEAEEIESVAIRISSNIEDAKAQMTGPVRIATPEGFGTYFVAHRLRDLSRQHPGITLELIADPGIVSLTKRQADIAVTMERPMTGPLRAQKLTDYEYGLYGADSLLSGRTDVEIDLSDFKLIGYIWDMLPTSSHGYLREIVGDHSADMSTSNILTQIAVTLSGYGLCILPCFMASKHKTLRRVLAEQVCFTRSYWLTAHVDARAPARAEVMTDFLRRSVEERRDLFLPSSIERRGDDLETQR